MSSLIRWDPFDSLEPFDALDRAFGATMRPLWRRGALALDTAMDMYETGDEVILELAVPGVKPEDVEISVVGDTVTIRGEIKADDRVDDNRYLIRERRHGKFSRRVSLPGLVQADKATAEFKNGVLTVSLPKAEAVRAKTIQVKAH